MTAEMPFAHRLWDTCAWNQVESSRDRVESSSRTLCTNANDFYLVSHWRYWLIGIKIFQLLRGPYIYIFIYKFLLWHDENYRSSIKNIETFMFSSKRLRLFNDEIETVMFSFKTRSRRWYLTWNISCWWNFVIMARSRLISTLNY